MMRLVAPLLFAALLVYGGCKTAAEKPGDELGTAQAFIRNCNNNRFDEAATLLESGPENAALLRAEQERFAAKTAAEMGKAKTADIIVHEMQALSEKEQILTYSTSDIPGVKKKLRLVRTGDRWTVSLRP